LQGQLALVTRVANDVQRRVGAGDLARTDALSVQAELADIQQGTQEAAQRLLESRAAWRLLTGLDDIPTLTGTTQPMGNGNALPHPEVQLAELTVEHQRNRLAVVSGEARDPTELKVQVSNEGGGGRPSQNTIGVSVRIPLGAQSRNSLPEAAASSALELSRTALMRTRMQVEASQRLSQQSLTAAEAQLATSQRRVDLLRERGTLVRRAFDAGEFALPELLRALASLSQAEAAHARHATALGLAQARFQLSHGVSP
jgi:outer membrane protein, heavy metal efflux system